MSWLFRPRTYYPPWQPQRPILVRQSAAATAYTLTPPTPASGAVGVASGNFTVTPNGVFTGTITPSDSAGGGSFTPSSLTFTASSAAQTFTYTPGSAGAKSVSTTNSGSLTDPSPVTYTASAGPTTITDNFNRANCTNMVTAGEDTPSSGGPNKWVQYQGIFLTAVYGINGNQAYVSAGDTRGANLIETSSPNASVKYTVAAAGGFIAIVFRASWGVTGANNYLFFYFQTGTNTAYIYKLVDGALTQIGTGTTTIIAGDIPEVRFNGSAISVYVNGTHVPALDTTETFNQTATRHGYMLQSTSDRIGTFVATSSDTSGLTAAFLGSDATTITVQAVKGEGSFQWYRSTTFGFTPGGGNILSGATDQYLVDNSGLSAGVVYEYACVAAGSSETSRCRAELGSAPIYMMMVGDSVTQGAGGGVTGDPPPLRMSKMLAKNWTTLRQTKCYNQGVIGATSGTWVSGSSNMVAAVPIALLGGVTHVMITLGINDTGVSAATYGSNIASQAGEWVSNGIKVVLNYPTGVTDDTASNRMATYLAQLDALVNNTTIFAGDKDGWPWFNEHPDELVDGTHQTDAGCESWSAMLAGAASRVIDTPSPPPPAGGVSGARIFEGF